MANEKHPIGDLMESSLQNLRSLVDADIIIGKTITTEDGISIIPISKVSFGYVSGGSDIPSSKPAPVFGGGAGGGVSVQPLAFIVIHNGIVELLQMSDNQTAVDKLVGMVPGMADKLGAVFASKRDDKKAKKEAVAPTEE